MNTIAVGLFFTVLHIVCASDISAVSHDKNPAIPPDVYASHYPEHSRHICWTCAKTKDCFDGKCWAQKCVYKSYASKKKCFTSNGQPCVQDRECISQRCSSNGKCIRNGAANTQPKTVQLGKECDSCSSDRDCATNFCFANVCVEDTTRSKARCGFLKICKRCSSGRECMSQACSETICINPRKKKNSLRNCLRKRVTRNNL